MSFVTITPGEIAPGQPVSSATETKIKDNFDDHESRILDLESFAGEFLPIIFRIGGYYQIMTGVVKTTANSTLYFHDAQILIDVAGDSGTTEIDILKKRGGGSFTSIFTTKPSKVYSAGNDVLSTNGVLDPAQIDIIAGDILRLDITNNQNSGSGLIVRIDWNRTP
jgi:hypothetical protein